MSTPKHAESQVKYAKLGERDLVEAGGMAKYLVAQADAGLHLNSFSVDGGYYHFIFFTVEKSK